MPSLFNDTMMSKQKWWEGQEQGYNLTTQNLQVIDVETLHHRKNVKKGKMAKTRDGGKKG